jgi:O-antigen ligase
VGLASEWYFLAGLPAAILLGYIAIVDFKKVFFLLVFFLPLTVEVWLPNGVVTDLPTEPMMVLMMGIFILFVIKERRGVDGAFFRHPITLALLLHLSWMFITVLNSSAFIISFKFFLAKTWYVTTFYFLAAHLVKGENDLKRLIWVVLIPLIVTVAIVLYRHSAFGFKFADINKVVAPFYRNKVAYACMLTIFMPFVWFGRYWYTKYSKQWWFLFITAVVMVAGIQFSYTRAAYAMLFVAVAGYFIIRYRLMKIVICGSFMIALISVLAIMVNNSWLDMKPKYERAITHDKFNNLLSATSKGEDVSTMERVYRWVAGGHMAAEKPIMGFGPGTFTKFYKSYTVTGFTTYVSANEEGSGIHSYYLMTLVEQGFPGLFFFAGLLIIGLLKGESIYHSTENTGLKRSVMIYLLSLIILAGLLIMNDLVETDKFGSFFFMCLALLVNADLVIKKR